MERAHRCRVRGYLAQGARSDINLYQVRYTSPELAGTGALLGEELRVYYNVEDLRTVRAFLASGTELGILKAQGAWGEVRHDLKLRREIMKLRGRRRREVTHDFIETFVEAKKLKAKRSRRGATEVARTIRLLAAAPTTTTPVERIGSQDHLVTQATVEAEASASTNEAGKAKIKPEKLSIGTGYASGI